MTTQSIPIRIIGTGVQRRNYELLFDNSFRYVINRGGTRSSKTHSIMQNWEYICSLGKFKVLITRHELPDLKKSALSDFKEYIENIDRYSGFQVNDLYDGFPKVSPKKEFKPIIDFWDYNATNHIYKHKVTGSEIHFKAYSSEQKARGAKFDFVQMTEGNEMFYEVFRQLDFRTKYKIVIDFNPSDENVWINRNIEQSKENFALIQSSYLDNPFLSEYQIKVIEDLRDSDPDYFHVYGDGNYGTVQGKIFDYKTLPFDEFKKLVGLREFCGVDFGWKSESVLLHIKHNDYTGETFAHEVFNAPFLKTADMNRIMEEYGLIDRSTSIFCDPNNPSAIEELNNDFGWNCYYANKAVEEGIKFCNRNSSLHLTNESTKAKGQFNTYKYKQSSSGIFYPVPVKFNDHAPDAYRYGLFTEMRGNTAPV